MTNLMAKRDLKKVQSVFKSANVTCSVCHMSYYSHIVKEVKIHEKYHDEFINGISWPKTFGTLYKSFTIANASTKAKESRQITARSKTARTIVRAPKTSFVAQVVSIDKSSSREIAKVAHLLNMVNLELNAPVDSQQWKDPHCLSSKAYILVVNSRAIGIVTTDTITDIANQGRWMIYSSQEIVPKQINTNIKIGISRIWIAPGWRRLGLATILLNTIANDSIYGISLSSNQIGFSQPSSSGGSLAKNFNGVKHKSGEILIPVYIEQ